MQLPDSYPPILADIAHLLHLRLAQHLPAEQAAALARAQTDDLSLTFSGCQIYIPKQDAQRGGGKNTDQQEFQVYCLWFGCRLKRGGPKIKVQANQYSIEDKYSGKVVCNIRR